MSIFILGLIISVSETWLAINSFTGANPFPWDEVLYNSADHVIRDVIVLAIIWFTVRNRESIVKIFKDFCPVIVIAVLYLLSASFMVYRLSLDFGLQTFFSVFAGIMNNVLLVLIAALVYNKYPNKITKTVYFSGYIFTGIVMIADMVYFWQTTMHIESVLFQNINIHSLIGVASSFDNMFIILICALLSSIVFVFRYVRITESTISFKYIVSMVLGFTVFINTVDYLFSITGMYALKKIVGMYAVVESEKVRYSYRSVISMPINVNFINKVFSNVDVIDDKYYRFAQTITNDDKKLLTNLGVNSDKSMVAELQSYYDNVVVLILESVHRDYINFYNKNIPEEATPFLNSLIIRNPHIDKFYSSAVPTTQGLNAIFRSHIIMDKNLDGKNKPSIFRSVQEKGIRGIFLNASTHYYADELREYPNQFGMQEYYAREYLEKKGYIGASGWGYHNDVIYDETLSLLEKYKNEKVFLVAKTLDMHQPYPYVGCEWEEIPESVQAKGSITVNGMYWVDKTLKEFFDKAEQLGLMDEKTLFVITSDHNPHSGGEYLDLVPNVGDKFSIAPIPLLFVSKNLTPLNNLKSQDFASQIDLAPTLLYLLGIESPDLFMGRNLLTHCEKPYALGYFGGNFYFWSDGLDFVGEVNKQEYDNEYIEVLNKYILNYYALWHK
ncbi:MAG: sulfatase-like hydrolase/transferase [Phascolarctobacterium sp.]|nr:sulfatase-like hydrolase/transferase [Phascolarctobacterium sp.]